MSVRPCGPDCYDEREHLEPVTEWLGNFPLSHGERTGDPDQPKGPYDYPCLCGHPDYMDCPHFFDGGIYGVTIYPDGTVDRGE